MALGTWGLSGDAYGPVDEREQERVVSRALEMGVSLVDTADAYGAGRMERLIGRALRDRGDVVVVTKGGTDRGTSPARKRFDAAYLRERLERSARRSTRSSTSSVLARSATGASAPATSRAVAPPCAAGPRLSSSRTACSMRPTCIDWPARSW
jgi:Aldo/keto reductase family